MTGFEQNVPRAMRQVLEDYADIVCVPRIGSPRNYLHPTLQLNIAAAKHGDSGESQRFAISTSLTLRRGRLGGGDGSVWRRSS